jgi:hypothetical protein
VIRRRPIPKGDYHWSRGTKPVNSLRYETILNGAVRVYRDGREVCNDNPKGWKEYRRRVEVMLQRQHWRCSLCGKRLRLADATFEHQRRRGLHGATRQDAIETPDGKPINSAAHWVCNVEKG